MSDSGQSDDSQKTEEPTPKKLEESRKKGQVSISREVNNWLMLMMGTVLVAFVFPTTMIRLREHMKIYIAEPHALPQAPGGIGVVLGDSFWEILSILALPLALLLVAAFSGPFFQVGPLFAPEAIKPSLSKISPVAGLKRLFSKRSLMEFAKGVAKMVIVGAMGGILLFPFYGQLEHTVGLPISMMLGEMHFLIIRLLMGVLMIMIVVAVIDLSFQRMEHNKKMRMTQQEVKDEYKQAEGDPHIKAKLRQLRQQKAQQRMMQSVPEADVVITNPTHYSIALKYNPEEMEAPVCVAKGQDETAFRIREIAKEHDIPLFENKPLARALYDTVEIDEAIPAEQFQAVAEVISYVFRLKGRA